MSEITVPEDIRSMPFEKALTELESLVSGMENGKLALEELMADFERGKMLSTHCRTKLNALERKIEILSRDDGADGQWQDFAPGKFRSDSGNLSAAEENDLPF